MGFHTCGKVGFRPLPNYQDNLYGDQDLYWQSLKITHPMDFWLFASASAALAGFLLMLSGVVIDRQDDEVYLHLTDLFRFGLLVYLVSTLVFFYFRLAPRFASMPAGMENIERLKVFILQYPGLSRELSVCSIDLETVTYGELKKIQKQVNRRLISVASKSIVKRRQK